MLKNNLVIRYLVVCFFIALASLAGVQVYKNALIEKQKTKTLQEFKLIYNDALSQQENFAELIFFDNLLYDKTIIELFSKTLHNKTKKQTKEELFEYLKDKFYYLKSFGIKNINFYLPTSELLLQMNNKDFVLAQSKRETILNINKNKQEYKGFEITENSASYVLSKPLFDKELNHLGAIELELDLDYLAKKIEKILPYNLFFVHKKSILEKNLINLNENDFVPFTFNDAYKIQNSVFQEFNNHSLILEQSSLENKESTLLNMQKQRMFAENIYYNKQYQLALFIPFSNHLTDNHNTYLIALGNEEFSQISQINQFLNHMVFIGFFIFLILFILIYNIIMYKEKNEIILKEHTDMLKAIDKYVVMAQTDQSGFITNITQAFCNISGYSKKEIIGRNINIIRHPDMSKKFFENMWNSLYKEKKWEGEIKNIDKNGNSYWVKGIIFPKYDIYNNLVGYISIRVNITDTKQLKKINNLLKEDLSNKLNEIKMRDESLANTTKIALMGKILDSLSHQWKIPVSNISIELANLKARIINHELNSFEVQKIHDEISYQLKTLSMSLNEFKTFFSNDEQNDKYNVYSALLESISSVKPECDLHNIKISLEAKEDIYCYGVFNELKQIMVNLLKNSIEHFIHSPTQTPTIKLHLFEENDAVVIEFNDNVTGESKNIIEKVFSNNYDEKISKDAGLNLYIAKLLLEKIGAKFWFENKENSTHMSIKLVSKDRRSDVRG